MTPRPRPVPAVGDRLGRSGKIVVAILIALDLVVGLLGSDAGPLAGTPGRAALSTGTDLFQAGARPGARFGEQGWAGTVI